MQTLTAVLSLGPQLRACKAELAAALMGAPLQTTPATGLEIGETKTQQPLLWCTERARRASDRRQQQQQPTHSHTCRILVVSLGLVSPRWATQAPAQAMPASLTSWSCCEALKRSSRALNSLPTRPCTRAGHQRQGRQARWGRGWTCRRNARDCSLGWGRAAC